jgi:hypothetical protein
MALRYVCLPGNPHAGTRDVCGGAAACLHTNLWQPPPDAEDGDGAGGSRSTPVSAASAAVSCQPPPPDPPKGNYVFSFGGESAGTPTDQFLIYDLDALEWLEELPKLHVEEAAKLRKHTEETQGRKRWRSLKTKVLSMAWMQQAGELRRQRNMGTEYRSPAARHSHSLVATLDGTRLVLFGGEGKKSSHTETVFRASLTMDARRRNNALAAGARSMKGKPFVPPKGKTYGESRKTVRSLFSDLQIYVVQKNRWVDVRRQLPSRFALVEDNMEDDSAGAVRVEWPRHRAGHTTTLLGPSLAKADAGDVNAGLTLNEMKLADLIRSEQGGLLVLFGGMEDPGVSSLGRSTRTGGSSTSTSTSNHNGRNNHNLATGNQLTSFTERPTHVNTTWAFDLRALSWSKIEPSGKPPPGTAFHSATASEDGNSMFVFGGESDLGYNTSALHQLKRTVLGLGDDSAPALVKVPAVANKLPVANEIAKKTSPPPPPDNNNKVGKKGAVVVWTWIRVQLLPLNAWSPSPRKNTSCCLHPADAHMLFIFGGNTTSSPHKKDGPSAQLTLSSACEVDVMWRFNTKTMKWEKPERVENGPRKFVQGVMVNCPTLGVIWQWGGETGGTNNHNRSLEERDLSFLLKLKKEEANSEANASLHMKIHLVDPMSEGLLQLPPIMGAISEEKQAKLFSLKSERDTHASDLQRLCKARSLRNYAETIALITNIRRSRQNMLSASQSMSQLILGKGRSQNKEDGEENREQKDRETGDGGLLDDIKAARMERASTAAAASGGGSRSLPRSQTAPGQLPFVAASYRREFFDFEVNYITSPPVSKNVRLAPLKDGRRSRMEVAEALGGDNDNTPEQTELEAAFDGAVVW